MAAPEELTKVTFEQLSELEKKFEDVEVEIIRQQVKLNAPLYEEREKVTAQVPTFWPLVVEQAPPDVDMYIQPNDSQVLLSSLESLSVSHFDIENGGDPRSIAIKFVFKENDWFTDRVLEKKFWYRRSADGWDGLVSEPVPIQWKSHEKDLTSGLLDRAVTVFKQDQEMRSAGKLTTGPVKLKDYTPEMKELAKRIEQIGHGVMSFFAWFGYRGISVSAEESRIATEKEQEKRQLYAAGQPPTEDDDDEGGKDYDEDEDEDLHALEMFPDGADLAIAISEDLWPSAVKYFLQAMEQDDVSLSDFEEDCPLGGKDEFDDEFEEEEKEEEGADEAPPAKKRKA